MNQKIKHRYRLSTISSDKIMFEFLSKHDEYVLFTFIFIFIANVINIANCIATTQETQGS